MELSESVQDQVQAARQVSFPTARRLLAETLGTFALTFVVAGAVGWLLRGSTNRAAKTAASGDGSWQ